MNIEENLKKITDVFGVATVQHTLQKLTQMKLQRCKLQLERARAELIPFEKRFEKSSDQAWKEFQGGELGDVMDIMEWMMLYENYLSLKKQYDRIMEIDCQ